MSYSNPTNGQNMAHQYLRQQIEQAGPVEQVLLLLDGAVKFLLQAKGAIERKDIQARYNANRRVIEILSHLLGMVDPVSGGAAGKAMFGIYSSLLKKCIQIDFDNSMAVCDELVDHLRTLRNGMAQALAAQQQGSKPATGTVVTAPSAESLPEGVQRNAVA
jgi:flagellar protein FliS